MALHLGGTIGELQSRMTRREFNLWGKYLAKHGPLNPMRMYDRGAAIIAQQINAAHGGKAKFEDFLLQYGEPEEDTDAEFAKLLSGGARVLKGRKVKIGQFKRR